MNSPEASLEVSSRTTKVVHRIIFYIFPNASDEKTFLHRKDNDLYLETFGYFGFYPEASLEELFRLKILLFI